MAPRRTSSRPISAPNAVVSPPCSVAIRKTCWQLGTSSSFMPGVRWTLSAKRISCNANRPSSITQCKVRRARLQRAEPHMVMTIDETGQHHVPPTTEMKRLVNESAFIQFEMAALSSRLRIADRASKYESIPRPVIMPLASVAVTETLPR